MIVSWQIHEAHHRMPYRKQQACKTAVTKGCTVLQHAPPFKNPGSQSSRLHRNAQKLTPSTGAQLEILHCILHARGRVTHRRTSLEQNERPTSVGWAPSCTTGLAFMWWYAVTSTHKIVKLPGSRQRTDVVREQPRVPPEEAERLRGDLEPAQVLRRTLLHRPQQVPVRGDRRDNP